jgi:hypothetical protein
MPSPRPIIASALFVLAAIPSAPARALPEVPAIERDVALIEAQEFTRPHIPPLRTSADGRVGVNPNPIRGGKARFYLMVPEGITEPYSSGPAGDEILAGLTPFDIPDSRFRHSADRLGRHYTICDATSEFRAPGESTNPYPCASDDCYDLVVITSSSPGPGRRRLWGTTITVRINSPKTADAAISRITTAPPQAGPEVNADSFFEPMVTNDGLLLVFRVATDDFGWAPDRTSEPRRHYVDLVYSLNAAGNPCDVRGWTTFYPISHAPYDFAVNSRYGFAMHPFRDATGQILPDGSDLGISYPWVDRTGTNLFFTAVGTQLAVGGLLLEDGSQTRYPARCVPGTPCQLALEPGDPTRGHGVVGLWTKGKMVLLDGTLNNTDYGMQIKDGAHRLVELYAAGTGLRGVESGEVRVGSGRDVSDAGPATSIGNSTIVDSLENIFHLFPLLQPLTTSDVVWTVNSGKASDEIAFDDWLDLDALIVSEMVGATSFEPTAVDGKGRIHYYDGWRDGAFRDPVFIQNAATALPDQLPVPAAGITYGNVRLEPVALGGIRGRGLWLDGQSGLEYEIAIQDAGADDIPWYFGIFLDSRFADDENERTLIGFPDGSRIRLRGRRAILYKMVGGATTHEIDLVEPLPEKSWSHLGFQVQPQNAGIIFYLNGFAFDLAPVEARPGFNLSEGSLFVGKDRNDAHDGVRGWIDRFVLIGRELGSEPACNQAHGTLAALDEKGGATSSNEWIAATQRYPARAHERIAASLAAPSTTRYICFHGYRHDYENTLATLPSGFRSVRRELVFPEGPLTYGQPRPDSSDNPFCLSCHSGTGKGGLDLGALVRNPDLPMQDDPRRQPSQPLRRVFGNLPANWLGNGKPPRPIEAPSGGLKVDALLVGTIDPIESTTPPVEPCPGDCDANGDVTIAELVVALNIALDRLPFATCRAGFECGRGSSCVSISHLTTAVIRALDGCSENAR